MSYVTIEIDELHSCVNILAWGDYEHCKAGAVRYVVMTWGIPKESQAWQKDENGLEYLQHPDVRILPATLPFVGGNHVEMALLFSREY